MALKIPGIDAETRQIGGATCYVATPGGISEADRRKVHLSIHGGGVGARREQDESRAVWECRPREYQGPDSHLGRRDLQPANEGDERIDRHAVVAVDAQGVISMPRERDRRHIIRALALSCSMFGIDEQLSL